MLLYSKIHSVYTTFESNINSFIYKLAVKYSFPLSAFEEWKHNILTDFKAVYDEFNIDHVKTPLPGYPYPWSG